MLSRKTCMNDSTLLLLLLHVNQYVHMKMIPIHKCVAPCMKDVSYFFWRTLTAPIQISTALVQVKAMRSGGQANIARLGEAGLEKKKKTTLVIFLVDQERSHLFQQCVTHSVTCERPVMDCAGPFPVVPYGTCCRLLSWTTHCPMRVYPCCTIAWIHKLLTQKSVCLYYILVCTVCVWVCVWLRGSGAQLMPREADKDSLDHREAGNESSYLGKPHTLCGCAPQVHRDMRESFHWQTPAHEYA